MTMVNTRHIIKVILKEDLDERKEKIHNIILNDVKSQFSGIRNPEGTDWKKKYYSFLSMAALKTDVEEYINEKYGIGGGEDGGWNAQWVYEIVDDWWHEVTYGGVPRVGDRIRIIELASHEPYLPNGTEGVVTGYTEDAWGPQLEVDWDNGSRLKLLIYADKFEMI
jgi:hypothetical protein